MSIMTEMAWHDGRFHFHPHTGIKESEKWNEVINPQSLPPGMTFPSNAETPEGSATSLKLCHQLETKHSSTRNFMVHSSIKLLQIVQPSVSFTDPQKIQNHCIYFCNKYHCGFDMHFIKFYRSLEKYTNLNICLLNHEYKIFSHFCFA